MYSNVVFGGNVLVWLMNALASVIRGTGNMLVPSLAVFLSVVLLVPLSPLLIFGYGPIPALGIAGGGLAVIVTTALCALMLAAYIWSGRCLVAFRRARLRWDLFADILHVGAIAAISTLQTSLTVALDHGAGRRRGRRRRGGRLWHRRAAGISSGPADLRLWRPAGRAGRHQHRRRPAARARCALP